MFGLPRGLALQLPFMQVSESMGNHDSKIVDAASVVRVRSLEIRGTPDIGRRAPLQDRDGVIRFPHRRKISSILIRNTVVPIAIRTTLGSCLAIEGVESPKTRSCYEHPPPGRSKTVRTAVGRSIFPADGIGRTSKPAAGEGEPADRRARQEQKKNPPG
jgi:hypothetical protein